MKNLAVIWLFCSVMFIQCSGTPADHHKPEPPDAVDQQILFNIHNTDFAEADRLIETRIKERPDSPKYYFLKSSLLFHARYFYATAANRDSLKQQLADYCAHTIRTAEKLPLSTENKFYLGSAHSYLSRVHVMNQSIADAYFAAKKGIKYLEEVIEENPYYYDAYLSMAIAEYFVATRANWWQSGLAFLSGFPDNKDNALDHLRLVQEKGDYNKNEATFVLAQIYQFLEPNPESARYYTRLYHENFPNNNFVAAQYNALMLSDIITANGVAYFQAHADSLTHLYRVNNAGPLNALGYRLINEHKPEDALIIFQINLKLFPEVANGYDSLAECYALLGKKDEAIRYYTLAYDKTLTDPTIGEEFRKTLQAGIQERLQELKK